MRRALISVSDKTGIAELGKILSELGFEIISSSGTSRFLKENGIDVIDVSDVTGFNEILGGRVKTLHPKIHGGILAVRDDREHLRQLEENGIKPIDLAVINLYPFEETVKKGADIEDIIENIDIGGPALIRACAKNYKYVTILTDPEDYDKVLQEIKEKGDTCLETKKYLSVKAFRHTAYYDSIISNVLNEKFQINEDFPEKLSIPLKRNATLRYGENPHQSASLYINPVEEDGFSVSKWQIVQGKQMSFNNYLDTDSALNLIKEFDEPACVIVKHNNPCGVGIDDDLLEAYRKALKTDPKSAFGGIVSLNKTVDGQLARELTEIFLEVIAAPDYTEEALGILQTKKNLRVIKVHDFDKSILGKDIRRVSAGLLIQDRDDELYQKLEVVTKIKPTKQQLNEMIFAYKIVKHLKSNGVVIVKDNMTFGIGPGQTSRVDSLETAVKKAIEFGFNLENTVLASEAFFPFRDSIDFAAKYGIKGVIQPGGSIRDREVIDACDEYGISMVFTGMRHFKH